MKIGTIIYNEDKPLAEEIKNKISEFFKNRDVEMVSKDRIESSDFVIVIGGDGTLLRASKEIVKNRDVIVFAINAGALGFLTEIKFEEFYETFDSYLEGNVLTEERSLLEVEVKGMFFDALNEVVISKENAVSKILNIEVATPVKKINTYKADGLIVATPTGSTAYSLSAGGPILMPSIKGIVMTPIAPHNLTARPIIIDSKEELVLSIEGNRKGCIVIDGECWQELNEGEKVKIKHSQKRLNLVLPKCRDYYGVLREKLKWGDNLC